MRTFQLFIMTAGEPRREVLAETVKSLALSDWGEEPTIVEDNRTAANAKQRQVDTSYRLLKLAQDSPADFVLFCEDDIKFNTSLRHNLERWKALDEFRVLSLYGGGGEPIYESFAERIVFNPCHMIGGSQAIVIRTDWVKVIVDNWYHNHPSLLQDLRIYRSVKLYGETRIPIHAPNLVDHQTTPSLWGGRPHVSRSFDPDWRSP